jgi:replicative DNA helicase
MSKLKNYNGEDRLVSSNDMHEALKQTPQTPQLKFGIENLDYYTNGFATGELVTVTGYSGFGKTTFCQTLISNLARQGMAVTFISYEVPYRQLFRHFPDPLPNFFIPKKNKPYDLEWLAKKIQEGIDKFEARVVFIDHLHYVIGIDDTDDRTRYTNRVGHVMRTLKQMTKDLDVAIFLCAHTKQPPDMSKVPTAPTMSSLRDSSWIAQESDAVYAIHRQPQKLKGWSSRKYDFTNNTEVHIIKQRETGVMGKMVLLTYASKLLIPAISAEEEKTLKA